MPYSSYLPRLENLKEPLGDFLTWEFSFDQLKAKLPANISDPDVKSWVRIPRLIVDFRAFVVRRNFSYEHPSEKYPVFSNAEIIAGLKNFNLIQDPASGELILPFYFYKREAPKRQGILVLGVPIFPRK